MSNTASPVSPAAQAETLAREELREISAELTSDFPGAPEESEVVLMEVDPHRLHAYWHLNPEDLEDARGRLGEEAARAALVLRIHDRSAPSPGGFPQPAFDLEVEGESGHRYVELWRDGVRCVAELGLRTPYGLMVGMARSQAVELPPAGRSPLPGSRALQLEQGAEAEGISVVESAFAEVPAVAPAVVEGVPRPVDELRALAAPEFPLERLFPLPGRRPPEVAVALEAPSVEEPTEDVAVPPSARAGIVAAALAPSEASMPAEPRAHGRRLSDLPSVAGPVPPSSAERLAPVQVAGRR